MTTAYLVDTGKDCFTGKRNNLGYNENMTREGINGRIGWFGFGSKASATRAMNELKALNAEKYEKACIVKVEYETHLKGVVFTFKGLTKLVEWEVLSVERA